MIEAKELRVGNWVVDTQPIFEIYSPYHRIVGKDIYDLCENKDHEAFKSIAYIPLTPEILEKLGFMGNTNCYSIKIKDETFLKIFFDPISYSICCHTDEINFYNEIFVHQLQNLYYSLTDEELEIKL